MSAEPYDAIQRVIDLERERDELLRERRDLRAELAEAKARTSNDVTREQYEIIQQQHARLVGVEEYAERMQTALKGARFGLMWIAHNADPELPAWARDIATEKLAQADAALAGSTEARTKTPPSSVNDGARLSPNEVAAQSGPACRTAQAVEARHVEQLTVAQQPPRSREDYALLADVPKRPSCIYRAGCKSVHRCTVEGCCMGRTKPDEQLTVQSGEKP